MAVVTTNLGTITAYGDAVAAGYTGTKAQWQALMANYATVGQQAAQDAQTASQAAQTATTKAGEASQSATAAAASAASITTPDATLTQAGVAADAKATGDEISDLKEELDKIESPTRNLWNYGDQTFLGTKIYPVNFPAGTYTFSAIPVSDDVQASTCRVRISKGDDFSSANILATFNLSRNTRNAYTFTVTDPIKCIELEASNTVGSSSGDTATFSNIQIESGSNMTEYVPHVTATDYLVRESVIMPFTDNKPVNVLLFGVKNDGSEDVSTLVNVLTEKYPLYFPAGIYKVSNQIKLKNSIYGAGISRYNRVDENYTWFVSDIDNPTAPLTSVFKIESNRTESITGINIMLNSYENGIDIYYTQIYTKINNVNISKIRGHGIFAYRTTDQNTGSRLLFIDDVSLFGADDYPTISVGIRFSSQIGDCRITNTEIMGTKVGVYLGNGIIYMSNTHIWCGPLAGQDNGNWWADTIGIKCSEGNRLIASNLYLDTCHHALEMLGNGGNTTIQNLIYAEDASVSNSSANDSVLIYTAENMARVGINGGFVNLRPDCKLSKLYNMSNPNLYITDLVTVGDYTINPTNADKFNQEIRTTDYSVLIQDDETDKYVEIFHIPVYNADGMASVSFTYENGNVCAMNIKTEGTSISFDMDNGTDATFYYKYNATDGLIVYQSSTLSDDTLVDVGCRFSRGFTPANYALIRRRTPNPTGNNEYVRESLTSATGLTQIT